MKSELTISETNDLQALLSELQSFPLLKKLVEAGGIHIHLHVNNSTFLGHWTFGNDSSIVGDIIYQQNERGNNIQGNDVSISK
jgi:hypothetical protein